MKDDDRFVSKQTLVIKIMISLEICGHSIIILIYILLNNDFL